MDEKGIISSYEAGQTIHSIAKILKDDYDATCRRFGIRDRYTLREAQAEVEKVILHHIRTSSRKQEPLPGIGRENLG